MHVFTNFTTYLLTYRARRTRYSIGLELLPAPAAAAAVTAYFMPKPRQNEH